MVPPPDRPGAAPARAHRPLGLSLALLATAILYGLTPLFEVYFIRRLSMTTQESFLLGGVEVSAWVWVQAGVGALILLLCALAWWGRPPWIRHALVAVIALVTLANLYRGVEAASAPADPVYAGQAQSILRGWLLCQLPALILVPLYTAWYLNRAPARAFYRRSPTSHPAATARSGATPNRLKHPE